MQCHKPGLYPGGVEGHSYTFGDLIVLTFRSVVLISCQNTYQLALRRYNTTGPTFRTSQLARGG